MSVPRSCIFTCGNGGDAGEGEVRCVPGWGPKRQHVFALTGGSHAMTSPPQDCIGREERRGGGGKGGSGTQKFVYQGWPFKIVPMSNSIAFGKSTSQRIYREQHAPKIGWKLHKYRLKHALHTLDDHFR